MFLSLNPFNFILLKHLLLSSKHVIFIRHSIIYSLSSINSWGKFAKWCSIIVDTGWACYWSECIYWGVMRVYIWGGRQGILKASLPCNKKGWVSKVIEIEGVSPSLINKARCYHWLNDISIKVPPDVEPPINLILDKSSWSQPFRIIANTDISNNQFHK